MSPSLKLIQQRLDAYERTVTDLVREFHDEMTLTYFSDRFGPSHPMSARADHGVHLMHQEKELRAKVDEFATQILQDFPEPTKTP